MVSNKLEISPPLYLVGMKIHCWKCQSRMTVVSILAPKVEGMDDQVCILSDIIELPKVVLQYVQKRVPTFKLKYSKTIGHKYYANTCQNCGSISGDFYLHSEPGAPFFPTNEKEAGLLYLMEIPIESHFSVSASWSIGTGDLIINHAKRVDKIQTP